MAVYREFAPGYKSQLEVNGTKYPFKDFSIDEVATEIEVVEAGEDGDGGNEEAEFTDTDTGVYDATVSGTLQVRSSGAPAKDIRPGVTLTDVWITIDVADDENINKRWHFPSFRVTKTSSAVRVKDGIWEYRITGKNRGPYYGPGEA